MNFRYLITVSLLFVLTATTLHGQSRRRRPVVPATLHIEDLPQQPLDTLATDDPETRIIIFSNNTWRYYRPRAESAGFAAGLYAALGYLAGFRL